MKLILKQDEFEHLPEQSVYNNNYYKHKKLDYIIYEDCHEDYNCCSFYLVENNSKIFIGCAQHGFGFANSNDEIEIDFKTQYT